MNAQENLCRSAVIASWMRVVVVEVTYPYSSNIVHLILQTPWSNEEMFSSVPETDATPFIRKRQLRSLVNRLCSSTG